MFTNFLILPAHDTFVAMENTERTELRDLM